MAHPLELAYNWRTPTLFATLGLVTCEGILLRTRVHGWLPVALVILLLWVLFVGLVHLRTRAYLMVEDDVLTVRHVRAFHRVAAADLVRVSEYLTPQGPSYRLRVLTPQGPRTCVAPVALLRRGHSTLFTWILTSAPQAELDRRSRRTVRLLVGRGSLPEQLLTEDEGRS